MKANLIKYFPNLMIKLDSIFKLCSAPDSFFVGERRTVITFMGNPVTLEPGIKNNDSSYAKELEHIYKCGYRWYSNKPIVTADHY